MGKTLESVLSEINKKYGPGAIVTAKSRPQCEVISTGSLKIDIATGIGGIPKGRITEISGAESSGKTTLALQCVGRAQRDGKPILYADMEHALDLNYAVNLGVDVSEDKFIICQPDTAEECLGIVDDALVSGVFGAVVIDSIEAMPTKAELDGEYGDAFMGVKARLMSAALRKLVKVIANSNVPLICINQIRSTMGGMPGMGPSNTTGGGRALKFYAALRLEVARIATDKADGVAEKNQVKVKVTKNKLAPPFREVTSELVFGEGFSMNSDILDLGIEASVGLFEKSGAWYTVNGERFQGKRNAVEYLSDNPEFADECEAKIRALYGIK